MHPFNKNKTSQTDERHNRQLRYHVGLKPIVAVSFLEKNGECGQSHSHGGDAGPIPIFQALQFHGFIVEPPVNCRA